MLRLDPGDERIATARPSASGKAAASTTSRAVCAMLRDADCRRHGACRQPDRSAGGGSDAPGRCRSSTTSAGCHTTAWGARYAMVSTSSSAGSGCAHRSAAQTAGTPPHHSSRPGAVDWDRIFARDGARWFHTAGSSRALSETTPAVALEAMEAAHRPDAIVSYDAQLSAFALAVAGRHRRGGRVNRTLAPSCRCPVRPRRGFRGVSGWTRRPTTTAIGRARRYAIRARGPCGPRLGSRTSPSSPRRCECPPPPADMIGRGWPMAMGFTPRAPLRTGDLDRVGGGDAFAAGLIYGLLSGRDLGWRSNAALHTARRDDDTRGLIDGDARRSRGARRRSRSPRRAVAALGRGLGQGLSGEGRETRRIDI